jgi:large subunit ribosomal protein L15
MRLHELKNVPGAVHRRKRVGCGEGSGRGKTCGRGGKGQTARSGGSVRPGFEGGQMPLYRKLPHRGFNNKNFRTDYAVVNLADLARIEGAKEINRQVLVENGLIRSNAGMIKILGEGEVAKGLKITADKFSASAKAKIEAAGGEAIVVAPGDEATVAS